MYALMATMKLRGSTDELAPLLASYSRSLASCPGLVCHTWLRDGEEVGLFHLFEDEAALQHYVSTGLLATLTAHPACSGHVFVRRFQVLAAAEREIQQTPVADEAALPSERPRGRVGVT